MGPIKKNGYGSIGLIFVGSNSAKKLCVFLIIKIEIHTYKYQKNIYSVRTTMHEYNDNVENVGKEMYRIGQAFKHVKNYDRMLEYYVKGSELGNADSFNGLGCYYAKMNNSIVAQCHFKSAIEKGHKMALINLGIQYEYVRKDKERAKKYYESAKKAIPNADFRINILREKYLSDQIS